MYLFKGYVALCLDSKLFLWYYETEIHSIAPLAISPPPTDPELDN
jgi:hypothetical protein